jgi:hypothetical protein
MEKIIGRARYIMDAMKSDSAILGSFGGFYFNELSVKDIKYLTKEKEYAINFIMSAKKTSLNLHKFMSIGTPLNRLFTHAE